MVSFKPPVPGKPGNFDFDDFFNSKNPEDALTKSEFITRWFVASTIYQAIVAANTKLIFDPALKQLDDKYISEIVVMLAKMMTFDEMAVGELKVIIDTCLAYIMEYNQGLGNSGASKKPNKPIN